MKRFTSFATLALLTGIGFAQEPAKLVLRDLNLIHSLPRIVDLTTESDDETATRVRAVLRSRQWTKKSGQTERLTMQEEPQSALVIDSPNGLLVAIPVADQHGKLLSDSIDGSQIAQFTLLGLERNLTVEIAGDPANEALSKVVIHDSETGEGLELNLADGKVYQLTSSATTSNAAIAGGTVGCVLSQLGELAKPCSATLLVASAKGCLVGISALPATSGLSAILALPACSAFIGKIVEALACAGFDCGLQAAVGRLNSISPAWVTPPTANVLSGQTLIMSWKLSTLNPLGLPLATTRVIGSTSPDPKSSPLFASGNQGGGSINPFNSYTYVANLAMPPITFVPGTKLYFVVEAVSGSNKWYSPVAMATVSGPTSNPGPGSVTTTNFGGSVAKGTWWQTTITVPSGRTLLKFQLNWSGGADLDLHLYRPDGGHVGYGGSTSGYSGWSKNPETIQVSSPQPGTYTVKVNGWSMPGSTLSFNGSILVQ